MKTVLVLTMGWVFFDSPFNMKALSGTAIAIVGIVAYGLQKMEEEKGTKGRDKERELSTSPVVRGGAGVGEARLAHLVMRDCIPPLLHLTWQFLLLAALPGAGVALVWAVAGGALCGASRVGRAGRKRCSIQVNLINVCLTRKCYFIYAYIILFFFILRLV